MKQPKQRTITVHWDGSGFVLMQTESHIIVKCDSVPDEKLEIPRELKQWLKQAQ